MKKYKRRNYLINKSLQLRYMAMIVILMVIISLGTGWIIYSTTWTMLLDRLKGVTTLDRLIIDLNRAVLIKTSFLVLASVCFAAVITMFIVHRVAGPLFRVKYIMRQIAKGMIPQRVKFRKGDELQDIAEAIDGAVHKIKETSENNLRILKETSACVEKAIKQLSSEESETQGLKEDLEHLKKTLGQFEIFQKESDEDG